MMPLLFLLVFVSTVLVFFGKRKAALGLYFFSLVLSAVWFRHHITDKLNLYF